MGMMQQMFAGFLTTTGSPSTLTTDSLFNYVSVLLNGETLVAPFTQDVSTNNLTIAPIGAGVTDGTYALGWLVVPQNAQSSYTLVLSDSGKQIFTATGGATWTIPANASVAYPIGTAVTFVNQSTSACTITITADTMYLGGAGTTGTRTLGTYGFATALKTSATTWIISGTSLT